MRVQANLAAALLSGCLLLLLSSPAHASDYRRPGLVGVYTDRQLTTPMNALSVILGPGQPQTFGQRFKGRSVDGGAEYRRKEPSGEASNALEEEWWTRGGVAFGLTEDWEAGALFLNFKYTPEFDYSEILVYVTRNYRLGDVDLAWRISFQTPGEIGWTFNPGIPLYYRFGDFRLDAGVFMPFGVGDDPWIGVNVPLRLTANITPHVFTGIDTGFAIEEFDRTDQAAIPLGFLAGYSLLFKNNVVDLVGDFSWDNFLWPGEPSGFDLVQASSYRISFGIVLHKLAVGAPK